MKGRPLWWRLADRWPENYKFVSLRDKEMVKCKCEENNPNKCDWMAVYPVDMLTNTMLI